MPNKKISELPDATLPISSGVKFEAVQGGVNVKVDADDMPGSSGAFVPLTLTGDVNVDVGAHVLDIATSGLNRISIEDGTAGSVGINMQTTNNNEININSNEDLHLQAGTNVNITATDNLSLAMATMEVNGDEGSTGEVLTSQGAGLPPVWDGSKAPLASPAFTGTPTAPTASQGTNTTQIATTAFVQTEGNLKVDEETFSTLTFASPTDWDTNNRQNPLGKVTATGNFTINMTNVKSGSLGTLKITASTASAFTLTFDTDFTNKDLITGATLTTYTFPANNGFEYLNYYICDGTTLYWVIGDYLSPAIANPWARVSRAATQSIGNNDITVALSFDTETTDNAGIYDSGTPTRLTIPGSGNKIATVSVLLDFATNTTGLRRIRVHLNGTIVTGGLFQAAPVTGTSTTIQATFQVECAGGDYIEIVPYQNSGGSLNVTGSAYIKVENR